MSRKNIFVGFDGFIDTIVRAVDHYEGETKVHMQLIEQFGKRISASAGRSTNIELDVICKKIGGNGPILCDALRVLGANTTYIGTLGDVESNIFRAFSQNNNAVFSVGLPGETRAVEFEDGKILLGEMYDTVNIDADRICSVCGRDILRDICSKNELLCFVNWTMLLRMNTIFELFLNDLIDKSKKISFFFDLADPSKRSAADVQGLIGYIQRFSEFGETILGLNLSEAAQILSVLGSFEKISEKKEDIVGCARVIRELIGCSAVFVHANTMSAGNDGNFAFVDGYFSEHPKISTGAGDHFNAGFLFNYLDTHDLRSALTMGSSVAKYYVDHACSPTLEQARDGIKKEAV